MKVKALRIFNDLATSQLRKPGEVFEVSEKRVEEINSTPHGALVEVVEKAEEKHKTTKKK